MAEKSGQDVVEDMARASGVIDANAYSCRYAVCADFNSDNCDCGKAVRAAASVLLGRMMEFRGNDDWCLHPVWLEQIRAFASEHGIEMEADDG